MNVLLFVLPAFIPLCVFWLYPICRAIWISFTNWDFTISLLLLCYSLSTRCDRNSTQRNKILIFLFRHLHPSQERLITYPENLSCLSGRYPALLPLLFQLIKFVRHLDWRMAEFHSSRLRRGYSFCLPLPDIFPLSLCDIGQQLQYDIRNQSSCQIFVDP